MAGIAEQNPISIDLSPTAATYNFALDIVIISIILSALALGISRAIGSRKLWAWGSEELAQSVINAAMLGVLVAFTSAISALLAVSLPHDVLSSCPISGQPANAPLAYDGCIIGNAIEKIGKMQPGLAENSFKLGMLSKMNINATALWAAPFDAMANTSEQYSKWAGELAGLQTFFEVQKQFLAIIGAYAFALFLPAGLILRMFFATRRLGGTIIAGSIGFFVIYPLVFAAIADNKTIEASFQAAISPLNSLGSALSPLGSLDWEKPDAIAKTVLELAGKNISSHAAALYIAMPQFLAALSIHAAIYPLISLAVTLVCIAELSAIFGKEFVFDLVKEA